VDQSILSPEIDAASATEGTTGVLGQFMSAKQVIRIRQLRYLSKVLMVAVEVVDITRTKTETDKYALYM